jgi:hypothetical protein
MKRTLLVAALLIAGLAQAQVAPAVPDQGEPITRFFLPSPSLDVVYAPGLHFDAAGRPERFVQQNADGTRTVMTWGYVGDAAEPATIRLDVLNGNVMEAVGTYAMDGLAAEDPSRLKEFAEKMGGRLADKLPAKRASKPSAKCYPGDYNQSDLPVDWSQQMRGYATPEAIARAVPQASLAKPWAQQKCEASYGPGVVPYPPPPHAGDVLVQLHQGRAPGSHRLRLLDLPAGAVRRPRAAVRDRDDGVGGILRLGVQPVAV